LNCKQDGNKFANQLLNYPCVLGIFVYNATPVYLHTELINSEFFKTKAYNK